MKILIFFLVLINGISGSFSEAVDFQHRSLLRALQKMNGSSEMKQVPAPEEVASKTGENGKFFRASGDQEKKVTYIYVGRVNSCRSGGCSAPGVEVNTNLEYFDYYILYNDECAVQEVKVFNYQATHGQEITLKAWLKQFRSYDGEEELRVGKQIDGIAGATISAHAIAEDIQEKTRLLREITAAHYSAK